MEPGRDADGAARCCLSRRAMAFGVVTCDVIRCRGARCHGAKRRWIDGEAGDVTLRRSRRSCNGVREATRWPASRAWHMTVSKMAAV